MMQMFERNAHDVALDRGQLLDAQDRVFMFFSTTRW